MNEYLNAIDKLHDYIVDAHWNGNALIGPDPIGKIHWRITRFVRSYLPWLPGDDRYIYLQGQAYWIKANLMLYRLKKDARYLEYALACADQIAARQRLDGAWIHPPIRGRIGFISTVEGVWASLGLVSAFKESGMVMYLDAALKWFDFQIHHIGFQKTGGGLAANYYSHSNSIVPNVTTMLIYLAGELHRATGDDAHLKYVKEMLDFIENSQLENGELPYALPSRPHFMCYQYNSFQFLDLASYYQISKDKQCRRILEKLAAFLAGGVTERGHSRYSCSKNVPVVNYWSAALGLALHTAHEIGLGDYHMTGERAFLYVLSQQKINGSFDFSTQNYGLLRDRRSYPRYLAMILYHLLCRVESEVCVNALADQLSSVEISSFQKIQEDKRIHEPT